MLMSQPVGNLIYKYRLYPTDEQERQLRRWMETARRFHNDLITRKKETGKEPAYSPLLIHGNSYREEMYSQSFNAVVKNVKTAYENHARDPSHWGKPKYRKYGNLPSIEYPQAKKGNVKLHPRTHKVYFSKLGHVKVTLHRDLPPGAVISRAIISQSANKWHVSFGLQIPLTATKTPLPSNPRTVGVDLGLKRTMVFSDGRTISPPRFRASEKRRRAHLHRNLSRKAGNKKGERKSNGWRKARDRLSAFEARLARQNDDFLRKLAAETVTRYDIVFFETLDIKSMLGKGERRINRSFGDAALGKLVKYMQERANKLGREKLVHLLTREHTRGTTQTCSRCGTIAEPKLTVNERIYSCKSCSLVMDRDFNACRNIFKRGCDELRAARPEVKPLGAPSDGRNRRGGAMKAERGRDPSARGGGGNTLTLDRSRHALMECASRG